MDEEVSSSELAEAIVDRLFPMADDNYRAQRVEDTIIVIEEMCFDDNYNDEEDDEMYDDDSFTG